MSQCHTFSNFRYGDCRSSPMTQHVTSQLAMRGLSNLRRNRFIDGIYSEVDRDLDGIRVGQCNCKHRFRQGFQSYYSFAVNIHFCSAPRYCLRSHEYSQCRESTWRIPYLSRRNISHEGCVRFRVIIICSERNVFLVTGVDLLSSVLAQCPSEKLNRQSST